MKVKHSFLKVFLWVCLVEACAFIASEITSCGWRSWYYDLNKSILTPPPYIFAIIWPILYVFIAIVCFYIFTKGKNVFGLHLKIIFGLHLLLNYAWSPVFFFFHHIAIACLIILLMLISLIYVMMYTYSYYKVITYLLLPYFLWSGYAFYLNIFILMNN